MSALEVLILRDRRARVWYGRWDVSQTRSNGEVKSKRGTAAPPWQIDIRRAAGVRRGRPNPMFWERTFQGGWLEEPWFFEFWAQTSGGSEVEYRIPKEIVPFCAVPPAWAEVTKCV